MLECFERFWIGAKIRRISCGTGPFGAEAIAAPSERHFCSFSRILPTITDRLRVAERLNGSIRRECVDRIIVLGEMHLRRFLKSCADYYNGVRTHRSLNKDAPVSRPIQRTGVISSRAMLGGLHHHYARV
jgi:integrase-like protein